MATVAHAYPKCLQKGGSPSRHIHLCSWRRLEVVTRPGRKAGQRCFAASNEDNSHYDEHPHKESHNLPDSACKYQPHSHDQDWRTMRARLVARENADTVSLVSDTISTPEVPIAPKPSFGTRMTGFSQNSWAHRISSPEVGCLLLSTQKTGYFFTRSVVLITSHDPKTGTIGYILNRPSAFYVNELQVSSDFPEFVKTFGGQRVFLGGPTHLGELSILHRYRGMPNAQHISEGLYVGGATGAIQFVKAGLAKQDSFHMLLGMSGWAPGQLEAEVQSGYWTIVSASPDLIFPSGGFVAVGNSEDEDEMWHTLARTANVVMV